MGVNCCSHDKEGPEITVNKPEKNVIPKNSTENAQANNLVVIDPNQSSGSYISNFNSTNVIYPSVDQTFTGVINESTDLNKYFTSNNTNKDPLAFTEKEIQDIFDQAMINAGVNQPQLNRTNYAQNNIQNNYQYQNVNNLNNQIYFQNQKQNINQAIPQNVNLNQKQILQQQQIINQPIPQYQQKQVINQPINKNKH